ncbi:MAG: hypothetical protein KF850_05170 [Labilithrix sp.]|nr:hypothetical protein [Labilithrix sp.]
MLTPKNGRSRPVTKLCLALETFRRTDAGRARDAKAFLRHYFPEKGGDATDRLFLHMPKEVRAGLLSGWGIRGKKSALRDDDERVRATVADALAAGDIDATIIERGVTPEILVDWAPLEDWWAFWRGAALPAASVQRALAVGRELSLFDERWFLENLKLGSPRLEGTDVICAAMSKDQIVAWLSAVHASGDASPTGLVAALGWETILAKTAHEALTFALDALARQIGLAEPEAERASTVPKALSERPATPAATPSAPPATPAATPSAPPATPAATPSTPPATPSAPPATPSTAPTPPAPPVAPHEPADAAKPAAPAKTETAAPAKTETATPAKTETATPAKTGTATPAKTETATPAKTETATPAKTGTATGAEGSGKPPMAAPKGPPPLPASAAPTPRASTPATHLPSVIIEPDPPVALTAPAPPPPTSAPPSARALFGAPADPPPVRPPARTLSGVGSVPPLFSPMTPEVAIPTFDVPSEDPAWAPPRAEPGDMGWDIVYGVQRPMSNNVQPKYNFDDDDEPTSEIALPGDPRRA